MKCHKFISISVLPHRSIKRRLVKEWIRRCRSTVPTTHVNAKAEILFDGAIEYDRWCNKILQL